MGIARGWEKRVIRTNITYAKRTVRIFSVSPQSRSLFSASFQTFCLTARASLNTQKYGPQSRSLFSASFQTFCLTARAYLNTQKYGLFCSLSPGKHLVEYLDYQSRTILSPYHSLKIHLAGMNLLFSFPFFGNNGHIWGEELAAMLLLLIIFANWLITRWFM